MVVNFKIFEQDYKYLSLSEEEKFEEYITPIVNKYLDKNIPKLNIGNFVNEHFNYRYVIDDIFDIFFYKKMDSYVRNNISKSITPKIRNSFSRILEDIILDSVLKGYKTNFYMKIEKRLIEIYEKSPKLYKNHIEWYGDEISSTVKDSLQYILDSEKYNI